METPKGNIIVPVARQVIDIVLPKVKAPHLGYIVLCGIAQICITRRSDVQRDVELSAAHGHVGIVIDVLNAVQAIHADDFGQFQSSVHNTPGVGANDPIGGSPCLGTCADAIALAF